MSNVLTAFLLTLFAGLSTGIGSLFVFFTDKDPKKFLSVSLGFSAGVMIYISMIDIFQEARESLTLALGDKMGLIATVLGFFGGMLLIALIEKMIPQDKNSRIVRRKKADTNGVIKSADDSKAKLVRVGLLTAISISIHNFPEGLASFVAGMQDASIAIPIVIAIAIHNIPEGISVAVPIYYGTGNRKKAIFYSFLSGLAEPLGAIIGYLILLPFMNDVVFGVIFALVAGIMVFISFDELLPTARDYGEDKLVIYGLVAGMVTIAISLIIF
ncbi:MAG: zinc transporter ZupT [Clostridia bacterium]